MREVILHAEHEEALALIARAEKILSAEEINGPTGRQTITRSLELRQRLLDGYTFHRTRSPQRIEAVATRFARLEYELEQAGLDPSDLSLPPSRATVILGLLARVLVFALLAPIAFFGTLVHFPAYRLAGYLSLRLSRDEQDVISTFKIISAMLFFPLTWVFLALIAWQIVRWPSGLATLVITPLAGYVAVRFFEELDRFAGSLSALTLFLMQRRSFVRLLAERAAIRQEILALGEETPLSS